MIAAVAAATAALGPVLQAGGGFIGLAVAFLVLAVVAYVVGARGVAGLSMEIARILVIIFIVLFIASLLFNFV
jgi:uncharacterized membrane protein YtjA (UPF0391 family)